MGMRKECFAVAAAGILTVMAAGASAQGQQQERGRPQDQSRQTDMDRAQDRDRMMDRDLDRTQDRDRDMTRDQMRDRDRDYDRDRLRQQDRDRIYASDLMTDQERTTYQNQLRALGTEKERVEFRLQHQKEMQERAKRRGVNVAGAPKRSQIEDQERARHGRG